jgi:phage virion morphogenesis protein
VPTITLSEFRSEIQRSVGKSSPEELRPLLKTIGILMAAAAKENIKLARTPAGKPFAPLAHPRPAGGSKPLNDTGQLGASITWRIEGSKVIAGTNRRGAALHQFGGTVSAKRTKYLAIPLTRRAARVRSPRSMPGLHPQFKRGANRGVLADKNGVAQFALVPSVQVAARPFLGFGPKLLKRIDAVILDWQGRRFPGGR